jgi:hypothetical protein
VVIDILLTDMIYAFLSWWSISLASLIGLWGSFARTIAPLMGAALILLIGWFLAFFVGRLVKKILGEGVISWEKALSGIGLLPILSERLGLSSDVGAFLGWLAKWFLIAASFMAAISILRLDAVNSFLGQLAAFLPVAVTAALIIFLGFFLGKLIDGVLVRLIGAIGVKGDSAGLAAHWIIVVFSILAAARYLGLGLDSLWGKFLDFAGLAGAIAVGFGFSAKANAWLESFRSRLTV